MAIFYPMFAMVVLTLSIAPLVLVARIRAVRSGRLSRSTLVLFDGTGAPPEVTKTTRHLANLFELPTLFYVACLTVYVLQLHSQTLVVLAWAYVALRAAHAFIHLSYNDLLHRLVAFMLSNVVLVTLWLIVLIRSLPP